MSQCLKCTIPKSNNSSMPPNLPRRRFYLAKVTWSMRLDMLLVEMIHGSTFFTKMGRFFNGSQFVKLFGAYSLITVSVAYLHAKVIDSDGPAYFFDFKRIFDQVFSFLEKKIKLFLRLATTVNLINTLQSYITTLES